MTSSDIDNISVSSAELSSLGDPEDFENVENAYVEEPEATEAENEAYLRQVDAEDKLEEDLKNRFHEKTQIQIWCKCSKCSVENLVKFEECLCCSEIDLCRKKMTGINKDDECITKHPGFNNVCLDKWVLEVAAIGLKTRSGRSYPALYKEGKKTESEFLRSVGYRQIIRFIFDYMGNNMRTPLPACVYH